VIKKKRGNFVVLNQQNMPTLLHNVSEADIERLSYERYAYPHPMIQKRIFAVYLKAVSHYCDEQIGFITGLHANTVSRWSNVYQLEGYQGLVSNHYGTNKSQLEEHACCILDTFHQQPPHSAAEAAVRIQEMTGVQRSAQQVRTFMRRHGLRFIKCGHIPAKADSEQQHQWMQNQLEPVIRAAQQGKCYLLFLDAAHFMLAPFVCCLWCMCRVLIKAGSGRNRINVLGAVDAISKKVTTMTNNTYLTAQTLMSFLTLLRKKYWDKPVYIVLDNARYQHCQAVIEAARSLHISLLFLPAYSPNLNIIERLWKFAKKKILYARYYDKPQVFHQAVEAFFKDINKNYKRELKSLLTLKFQFFDQINPLIYPL
jgi:transposase